MDGTQDAAELQAARFAEVIRYALKVVGGVDGRASQRELSAAIGVAPTMVTRYLSNSADFSHLRALTVERLAAACNLEVGAVYAWIRHGREAAMAYQQQFSERPIAFEPIDLARELVLLLEGQPPDPALAAADYGALLADLEDQRRTAPALFDRLVAMAEAAGTLTAIANAEPLDADDWLKLQQLLDVDAAVLQQRYGFGQTAARTSPQHA